MLIINRKPDQGILVTPNFDNIIDEIARMSKITGSIEDRAERSALIERFRDIVDLLRPEITAASLISINVNEIKGKRVVLGIETAAKEGYAFGRH